jgi:N-acetylneuraminate lyase
MYSLKGLIAAPFTAMKADRSINFDIIEKQAAFYTANGVSGVFVCGTTGEGFSLTTAERIQIADTWCKTAPKELKVVVHAGDNSIDACKVMAANAQKSNASAIGAIAPNFFKPGSVDVLVEYCRQIASAAPELPFYFYHMPSMTGVNFPMIDFLQKASGKIKNLAGIKFTYEDLMDFHLCQKFEDGRFDMLFGRDEILLCGLALGAKGAIGSTYNFASPLYNQLIDEFNAGNLERARVLQHKSMEMIKIIGSIGCPFLSASKAIMKELGIDCGPVRLPLTDISPQQQSLLMSKLEQLGFFDFCSKSKTSFKVKTAALNQKELNV